MSTAQTYRVVFDLTSAPEPGARDYIEYATMILVALVIALVATRLWPKWAKQARIIAVLVALYAAFMLYDTWSESEGARAALLAEVQAGRARVVEGRVEHFHPAPASGEGEESFDVAGQHYAYWQDIVTHGFNHVAVNGGPVREGLRVRVTDVGSVIVRLEIAP